MQTIAVLLTVYNRKSKTLKCLENLLKQEKAEDIVVDVYLTDDGCTDGTPEAVREQYPQVHIIQGDGNLFWNRGMYVAWKEASKRDYDFYLWLNDDTNIYQGALEYMLKSNETLGTHCSIAGATCSPTDNNQTTYSGYIGKKKIPMNGTYQKVDKINGNFVLIPKSVYLILGTNDPYYHHSFGDMDYGLRAQKVGILCYITDRYIGTCEGHDGVNKCFDPSISILERFKYFYSPLGMNPFEFFHMNKRAFGIIRAIIVFATTHTRVMFPQLWK